MSSGHDENEMVDGDQRPSSAFSFLNSYGMPLGESSAPPELPPTQDGASFFPTARLHPWQLPSLNVDFDASSSTDFSDSFPSSGPTSSSVSQFTSPLSPSIYNHFWDVNIAPTEDAACAQQTQQQQFDLQWNMSHLPTGFIPNPFIPDYTPQVQPMLDDASSRLAAPSTDFFIPQATPLRMGRSHSNSLSSVTTTFNNMSTTRTVPSPAPAPAMTTTPLLLPSLRRGVRSLSNPSLKSSPSPSLLKPSHSQVSLAGSVEVDELMQINEGETMDLVLPPSSAGSSTAKQDFGDEVVPVEDLSMYSQGRFIVKLWRMMHHQPPTTAIEWSEDGTDVVVPRAGDLCAHLLPLYFRHSNFSSFVRQLVAYGFKKQKYPLTSDSKRPTEADWRWEFSHPDFQRGRSDLMEGIKRKGNDNGVSSQPYTRAPQSAPRATRRQVKAAPVAPQLQHQQEFATQKAQLNFYILRHRETQMELEALQIAVDRERGRANRLAMLGVTLLSICRTSFPGALTNLPPYSDEDLMVIHSPIREGFAEALDFEDGEEEECSTPPPPSLDVVTQQLGSAWQSGGTFNDGVKPNDDPTSASSLHPSSGLQTPTFGGFNELMQDHKVDEDAATWTPQQDNRLSKRQRFDEAEFQQSTQPDGFTPARLRSYSTSSARLTRSSQTFPRPVRTKRPSQSQLMTGTQG